MRPSAVCGPALFVVRRRLRTVNDTTDLFAQVLSTNEWAKESGPCRGGLRNRPRLADIATNQRRQACPSIHAGFCRVSSIARAGSWWALTVGTAASI